MVNYDRAFFGFISGITVIFSGVAFAQPAHAHTPSTTSLTIGIPAITCPDDGQISLNRCAVYWSKTTDFLQTQLYQDEVSALPQRYRPMFTIAENDWRRYRQRHCDAMIEPFTGASMAPMLYHRCLATVTNDRIADLQGLTPVSDSPDVDQIQSLITELKQDPVQQIWNRYQAEYCQFEAQAFRQSPRSQSCPSRLSQARLRHLKAMMESR
ncbi:lysozyme inhibitor LprI family protein [Alkalinema pantanalense CENA528]|uniref:lysozyme inhibitor LprI family protein n=1 Tax=Alkalinema pantanalense TaxID=1620705 RepID=UPI003D6E89E3